MTGQTSALDSQHPVLVVSSLSPQRPVLKFDMGLGGGGRRYPVAQCRRGKEWDHPGTSVNNEAHQLTWTWV